MKALHHGDAHIIYLPMTTLGSLQNPKQRWAQYYRQKQFWLFQLALFSSERATDIVVYPQMKQGVVTK